MIHDPFSSSYSSASQSSQLHQSLNQSQNHKITHSRSRSLTTKGAYSDTTTTANASNIASLLIPIQIGQTTTAITSACTTQQITAQQSCQESHRLDEEFQSDMQSITQSLPHLSRHDRIRVDQWIKKLSLNTPNLVWKQNRNLYSRLLSRMTNSLNLQDPFTKLPPDSALPHLTKAELTTPVRNILRDFAKDKENNNHQGNQQQLSIRPASLSQQSATSHQQQQFNQSSKPNVLAAASIKLLKERAQNSTSSTNSQNYKVNALVEKKQNHNQLVFQKSENSHMIQSVPSSQRISLKTSNAQFQSPMFGMQQAPAATGIATSTSMSSASSRQEEIVPPFLAIASEYVKRDAAAATASVNNSTNAARPPVPNNMQSNNNNSSTNHHQYSNNNNHQLHNPSNNFRSFLSHNTISNIQSSTSLATPPSISPQLSTTSVICENCNKSTTTNTSLHTSQALIVNQEQQQQQQYQQQQQLQEQQCSQQQQHSKQQMSIQQQSKGISLEQQRLIKAVEEIVSGNNNHTRPRSSSTQNANLRSGQCNAQAVGFGATGTGEMIPRYSSKEESLSIISSNLNNLTKLTPDSITYRSYSTIPQSESFNSHSTQAIIMQNFNNVRGDNEEENGNELKNSSYNVTQNMDVASHVNNNYINERNNTNNPRAIQHTQWSFNADHGDVETGQFDQINNDDDVDLEQGEETTKITLKHSNGIYRDSRRGEINTEEEQVKMEKQQHLERNVIHELNQNLSRISQLQRQADSLKYQQLMRELQEVEGVRSPPIVGVSASTSSQATESSSKQLSRVDSKLQPLDGNYQQHAESIKQKLHRTNQDTYEFLSYLNSIKENLQ